MNRSLLDYQPAIDALEGPLLERADLEGRASASEMQMAAELLEHADESALESYLARMISHAEGHHVPANVRAALAKILGQIGRPLLRQTGLSSQAQAGRVFGLELEGLSPEDQAFEVARHFSRFATDASRRAGNAIGADSAQRVAQRAAIAAARKFAPGLLPMSSGLRPSTFATSGTWFRRGREIVVLNP